MEQFEIMEPDMVTIVLRVRTARDIQFFMILSQKLTANLQRADLICMSGKKKIYAEIFQKSKRLQ